MAEKLTTIAKTFLVLECLGDAQAAVTLDHISGQVGLCKPTAHRILNELVGLSYLTKSNHRYEIGVSFLSLAKAAFRGTLDEREIASKYMAELRNTYDESVNFAIWDSNMHAVLIASVPSRHVFRIENKVGQLFPLHSTTIGKVIAAHLGWDVVEEALKRDGMPQQTRNTITDPARFREELKVVKERGYALDDEESFEGVRCVAVPVFRAGNVIYGGLSISGPANRMNRDVVARMAKDLQIASYRIALELSFLSE